MKNTQLLTISILDVKPGYRLRGRIVSEVSPASNYVTVWFDGYNFMNRYTRDSIVTVRP